MTPETLSGYFISADWYLIASAVCWLLSQALIKLSPDTMFTTVWGKRLGAAAVSVVVPLTTVLSTGLAAHVPPRALVGLCIAAFLGSTTINRLFSAAKTNVQNISGPVTVNQPGISPAAKTDPPAAANRLMGGILTGLLVGLFFLVVSCLPVKNAILSQEAQCKLAQQQNEPAFVSLECDFVDLSGDILQTFTAKVPADAALKARLSK